MIRQLCCFLGVIAFPLMARADAPEVSALVPAGGQRGTEVVVKWQGKVDPSGLQVWFDRPGIEVVGAVEKESLKLKIAADAVPGTTWLRFHNADGASALRPFVIGTCGEVLEVEPNDAVGKSQPLTELPVTINGALEKAGDVDGYRVTLRRGETLAAVLAGKQTLGSPMDASLQIVDAKGFVVDQNDDQRGFDPRVVFVAPKDGEYVVRTFAFPAQPDTTVRFSGAPTYLYRLTLATGPFVDHVLPCAVTADKPAKVRPLGWSLPGDVAEIDVPALAVGVRSVWRDGWQSTAKVLVTPHASVVEQEPNALAQPQVITTPVVACGVIGERKDVDAWKFTAKTGQRLSMRLSAISLGSALDALVRIYDSTGMKTAEVDDAVQDEADVVLEFTAPKDGDYVVTVTDRFSHGGPGHWYALSLAEPTPAAVLQVAGDSFAVKGDTPLEIPVTVERRLGYALPLKISVEGLPDGVTAEALVSEPQGDSSKLVKLSVKSTRAEKWTGPVRIVGKAEGDTQPERLANFKTPLTDEWLPNLWMTVTPK